MAKDKASLLSGQAQTEVVPAGKPERPHQSVKLLRRLCQRLRLWAAFLGKGISEIVEEAVTRHLDDLERDRAERRLPPLPRPDP